MYRGFTTLLFVKDLNVKDISEYSLKLER